MKNLEKQLFVLLDAINKIVEYNTSKNFSEFLADEMAFDAILLQLLHLGESTRKLSENFEVDFLPIQEMKGMRNFIAHDYLGISEKVIYNTVIYDIPEIKKDIENYLNI